MGEAWHLPYLDYWQKKKIYTYVSITRPLEPPVLDHSQAASGGLEPSNAAGSSALCPRPHVPSGPTHLKKENQRPSRDHAVHAPSLPTLSLPETQT